MPQTELQTERFGVDDAFRLRPCIGPAAAASRAAALTSGGFGMTTRDKRREGGDVAPEDGFYEAYVDDVLETYVGPPPDHCVFMVLRRTSGRKIGVKLTARALDALERSVKAAREHLDRKRGVH